MVNYLLASTFIHSAILLGLCFSPDSLITSGTTKVEVNIIQKTKKQETAPLLHTPSKLLNTGTGTGGRKIEAKIDMTDYANQLKAVVDPVWVRKIAPYRNKFNRSYTTIVLIFPDRSGRIVLSRVIQSSGLPGLDNMALQTFREIGSIPIPPEALVKEGIIWEFTL